MHIYCYCVVFADVIDMIAVGDTVRVVSSAHIGALLHGSSSGGQVISDASQFYLLDELLGAMKAAANVGRQGGPVHLEIVSAVSGTKTHFYPQTYFDFPAGYYSYFIEISAEDLLST